MHGWAPEVIGAAGTPQTSPEGYLGVFFTRSPASRQAGQESLRRMYAKTQDRDTAPTGQAREAQYDAVYIWGTPDHALLQRLSCLQMPVFVADSAHGFLFQHHAEFGRDVDEFLRESA